jgi:Fe-S cluster assembly iron-binding protein IscA
MTLDEPQENEQPVDVNGIGVLVADTAKPYVDATVVDYVKETHGEGFVLTGAGGNC